MSRSLWSVPAALALGALLAPAAGAQSPARTVEAQGVATVKVVKPADRRHEPPIRAAVQAAIAKALPLAIADARTDATSLAQQAGLTLGPVLSISDVPPSPFGYGANYGTFGPNKFCGTIRSPVFKRLPNGGRRVVRIRTRHGCRVPSSVTSQVTVTFTAT